MVSRLPAPPPPPTTWIATTTSIADTEDDDNEGADVNNESSMESIAKVNGTNEEDVHTYNDTSVEENVDQGSRIGMIRFGSRADLYFENYEPLVKVNQRAVAGETLIAKR